MLTFHRFGLPRRVLLLDNDAIPGGAIVVPHSVFRLGRLEVDSEFTDDQDAKRETRSFTVVWQSETAKTPLLRYDDENKAISASRAIANALKPRRDVCRTVATLSAIALVIFIACIAVTNPFRARLLAMYGEITTMGDSATAESTTVTAAHRKKQAIESEPQQGKIDGRQKQPVSMTTKQGPAGFVALPD